LKQSQPGEAAISRWPLRRCAGLDFFHEGHEMTSRNILYLIIGALVVVGAVLGYQVYQDHKEPKGLNINIGPGGLSIKDK
jgi:hypothetical protein